MDVVLGVSMTPMAVRIVLVEGADGDGATLDSNVLDAPTGDLGGSGAAQKVVEAILGTRESVAEGAHQLTSVGVAWTDHADGARLRQALRASGIDDVVMVSELHAASALAQAVGRRTGCARTALMFVEGSEVTVAVVRTADGAVVAVQSAALHAGDVAPELQRMVAALEHTAEPPQAVFLVGAGRDVGADVDLDVGLNVATLAARIAENTTLPVHAPDDADLALARGAALAAAATPLFEAETVVVAAGSSGSATEAQPGHGDDTAAGATQMAAAGYMAPLGYSAVVDDGDDADMPEIGEAVPPDRSERIDGARETEEEPFLLVGSALATIFVVGVVALVISLAVTIRPTSDQRLQGETGIAPAPTAAGEVTDAEASLPLETIQAPVPVVREAPRTAFATAPLTRPEEPKPAAPVLPAAPLPAAPAPLPAAPAPAPAAASSPGVTVPAAPVIPPIVVAPVIPFLPPLTQAPVRMSTSPGTVTPSTTTVTTTVPSSPVPSSPVPSSTVPSSTVPSSPVPSSTVPSTTGTTPADPPATSTPPVSEETSTPAGRSETSTTAVTSETSTTAVTSDILIPTPSSQILGGDGSGTDD